MFGLKVGEQDADVNRLFFHRAKEEVSDFSFFVFISDRSFDFDVETERGLFNAIVNQERIRCEEDEIFIFDSVDG